MKTTSSVFIVLAFFLSSIHCLTAAVANGKANLRTNTLAPYPWSDASAFVRIPKRFIKEANIFSMSISNFETMEYVLTQEFISLCAVTPVERINITTAVANALHAYHSAQAKKWTPTDEKGDLHGWEPSVREQYAFKRELIPEERALILDALHQQILAILGQERADLFWEFDQGLNAGQGFGSNFKPPPGQTWSNTHTFLLRQAESGMEIDLNTTTGGGGGSAGPYAPSFDQYAPESMKPVLARWRKVVADSNTNRVHTETTRPRSSAPTSDSAATMTKWQEGTPFVEVPKSSIRLFRLAGLNVDREVSDEAAILFGLTASERQSVDTLYKQMNTRFERLEKSHFARTNTGANSFVIRAFPEQAQALQAE